MIQPDRPADSALSSVRSPGYRKALRQGSILCLLFGVLSIATGFAADTVHFNFDAPGETKAMTEWGADTAWADYNNFRQTVEHLGDEIDVVRINFYTDEALVNGELGPNSRKQIDYQLKLAAMAGDKPLTMCLNGGTTGTDPWYANGEDEIRPDRWVALMEATQRYTGKHFQAVEPFLEPDYWPDQGTPKNLYDVLVLLQSSPIFKDTELHAPSTLNSANAKWWYDEAGISGPTTHGSTHQLAGSADDYIGFIKHVIASGDVAYDPELHSMAEVLFGCEYGMFGGIWWADVLLPRGVLVRAVQGKRLGYAENRPTSSAAAVYRAPDGKVYGFAGSFERHGPRTNYRFVCENQDLYFNGIGPMREFMYFTQADQQGGFFHIEKTPSIPPLDGHAWKIKNRASSEVLEVANASRDNGGKIGTAIDNDEANQKWRFERGRDGYYAMINEKSGKAADVRDGSLKDGENVHQWAYGGGFNQKWYIDDAGGGWFYIRNGNSNKYLAGGGNAIQESGPGGGSQQWQFIPADPAGSSVPTTHFVFEGNVKDSAGSHGGTANGSPAYGASQIGGVIDLNGVDDFIALPSGICSSADATIAAWVNWDGGGAQQRIFDFGAGDDAGLFLKPSDDQGMMVFSIKSDAEEEQLIVTDALPVGKWVHMALTLRGNTGILYIDGKPKVAAFITMNPSDVLASGQQHNYIGRSQCDADPLYNGQIGDFRIYDYALSMKAIADVVAGAPTPITPKIRIADGAWQEDVSDATIAPGGTIVLGPQADRGEGSWSWSGPGGFASTGREVTLGNVSGRQIRGPTSPRSPMPAAPGVSSVSSLL